MSIKQRYSTLLTPVLPSIKTGIDFEVSFMLGGASSSSPSGTTTSFMLPDARSSMLLPHSLTPRVSRSDDDEQGLSYDTYSACRDRFSETEMPTQLTPTDKRKRFRLSYPSSPHPADVSYHRRTSTQGSSSVEPTIRSSSVCSRSSDESTVENAPSSVSNSTDESDIEPGARFNAFELAAQQFQASSTATINIPDEEPRLSLIRPGPRRRVEVARTQVLSASRSISDLRHPARVPMPIRPSSSHHQLRDTDFDNWINQLRTRSRVLNLPEPSVASLAVARRTEEEIEDLEIEEAEASATTPVLAQRPATMASTPMKDESELTSPPVSSCGSTACELSLAELAPPTDPQYRRRLPDGLHVERAQRCELKSESGNKITFKQLLSRSPRTVIVFIRFFWCALCQTYVRQLSESFPPDSGQAKRLEESGTRIVLIGTGNWKMIASYREMLKCPFEIYSDSSVQKVLFAQLGLERTMNSGKDSERGSYLSEMNIKRVVVQSIVNINRMPFRNPGSFTQLGGEFCFESESNGHPNVTQESHSLSNTTRSSNISSMLKLNKKLSRCKTNPSTTSHYQKAHIVTDRSVRCVYANRMTTSRDHGSLSDLFDDIGLRIFD